MDAYDAVHVLQGLLRVAGAQDLANQVQGIFKSDDGSALFLLLDDQAHDLVDHSGLDAELVGDGLGIVADGFHDEFILVERV